MACVPVSIVRREGEGSAVFWLISLCPLLFTLLLVVAAVTAAAAAELPEEESHARA